MASNSLTFMSKHCMQQYRLYALMSYLHVLWEWSTKLLLVGFICCTPVCKVDVLIAGLGTENLIKVECNAVGQMLPEALDQALVSAKEQGKVRPSRLDAF